MTTAEKRRSLRLLAESGEAIADGVARELAGWVERQVTLILDAWGRADNATRVRAEREAVVAGSAAATRVAAELHALFALDPAAQHATPLEIVRSAYREPTAVLAAAGIPPVERSGFDERAWPDDRYGLVVRDLGDLGDPELAPLHFAWGMAKAGVLRSRAEHTSDGQITDR
jgi:hypothetical protein